MAQTSSVLYHRKAHGKLLLTGEYFVLDGAWSIALPTIFGQTLTVNKTNSFSWNSKELDGKIWLSLSQESKNLSQQQEYLIAILKKFSKFSFENSYEIVADFPRDWGLGSSSTFISLLADYFEENPYILNQSIFRGSGYDIACAFSEEPILYRTDTTNPSIQQISIPKEIQSCLYFAYSNKKQNSREGISRYKELACDKSSAIERISNISQQLLSTNSLNEWIDLLNEHESLVSNILGLERISKTILKGFPFFTKSLGAWGGDFFLILSDASKDEIKSYLNLAGINTIFDYQSLIQDKT